jgi:hypothetical protein
MMLMYVCVDVCAEQCVQTRVYDVDVCVCVCVVCGLCVYVCMHEGCLCSERERVRANVAFFVSMYVHVCVIVRMHTYIDIYIHTHTHIHACMHTYIQTAGN